MPSAVLYSRLRRTVSVTRTMQTRASAAAGIRQFQGLLPLGLRCRSISDQIAITINTMTAASGRYIRRSAPTSVAIGRMLDEGASVTKNQVPRNAISRRHRHAATVATASAATQENGSQTSPNDTTRGTP